MFHPGSKTSHISPVQENGVVSKATTSPRKCLYAKIIYSMDNPKFIVKQGDSGYKCFECLDCSKEVVFRNGIEHIVRAILSNNAPSNRIGYFMTVRAAEKRT